ncbi:hypothetical protein DPMN_071624 [Dreissena polymorpha]|uniref:Uncharacterized protein n=1 Tax=Dreissena polymorpha TaxID=45954 RepID=A0A9D4BXD9_DREPO|nr:hypothetical protein DPMN_071624 [Dreissena polymorpha]
MSLNLRISKFCKYGESTSDGFIKRTHVAHGPLEHVYDINVQDISMEKLAQVNLFLSKLMGTQIGFTTCGLLTITKEFILTV